MGRAGGLKSCKTMQKIISTSLIALRSLQGPGSSAPLCRGCHCQAWSQHCTPWHSQGKGAGSAQHICPKPRDSAGAAGIKHPDFSAKAAPALRGEPACASVSLPVG